MRWNIQFNKSNELPASKIERMNAYQNYFLQTQIESYINKNNIDIYIDNKKIDNKIIRSKNIKIKAITREKRTFLGQISIPVNIFVSGKQLTFKSKNKEIQLLFKSRGKGKPVTIAGVIKPPRKPKK